MGLSVADIVAKFPVKTLPVITGEPDYETIGQIIQTIYGNAASLPTTIGGGVHAGHIGLIMTPLLYAGAHTNNIHRPQRPRPNCHTRRQRIPSHPQTKQYHIQGGTTNL
jgi:hypothetical protein